MKPDGVGAWANLLIVSATLSLLAIYPGARVANAQMYDPEDYAIPPAPIPHRPPPFYDPRDDLPPLDPDFEPPIRPDRRAARIVHNPAMEPPPRRLTPIPSPGDPGKAHVRLDGSRLLRAAPAAAPEIIRGKAPSKALATSDHASPAPKIPPPPSRPSIEARSSSPAPSAPVVIDPPKTPTVSVANTVGPGDHASNFVNRGESKVNLD